MSNTIDVRDGIDHDHLSLSGRLSAGLRHDGGDATAGRDLTTFGSPEAFEQLLADLELPSEPIAMIDREGRQRMFVWVADAFMLVTGANPITGEHASSDRTEPGYASYIGMEGDEDAVRTTQRRLSAIIEDTDGAYTDGRVTSNRAFI